MTYDAIGNPLNYRDGITFTWQNGRELASFSNNANDITYSYDASGMRTVKDIEGLGEVYYIYENGLLQKMDYLGHIFTFSYDAGGTPIGFKLTAPSGSSMPYYYGTNSRGDIVAIYNYAGTKVATYSYDAYGKLIDTTILNTSHTFAANNNPLRYRGYVYDTETGFYYLQTRYYDPTTCRFVNADGQLNTDSFNGYNTFAYCNNNPILSYDPNGTRTFECCPYGNCWWCKAAKYMGAAKEYVPSYSTEYNCVAHSLNENEWMYIGGSSGAVDDYSIDNVSDMYISTVESTGRNIRPILYYGSPINANEYRVALRVGTDEVNGISDYHFMIQHSDGTWSHKPGILPTRLIDGDNPTVVSWDLMGYHIDYDAGVLYEYISIKDFYDPITTRYFAISE